MIQARVEKKDPEAIYRLGKAYGIGKLGLPKDDRRAVELWTEAAALGSIDALFNLGNAYHGGIGVQEDKTKGIQLWAKVAMQGHVESRYFLGIYEGRRKTTTVH